MRDVTPQCNVVSIGWALTQNGSCDSIHFHFLNTLRPEQKGQHFAENILKWTFLTHWGWVTHICVGNLTIIGSDNGLSPGRRQAIIWTNAVILLIGPFRINFSEILIAIHTFSFRKMHFKVSSGKLRPFCFGRNVLMKILVFLFSFH